MQSGGKAYQKRILEFPGDMEIEKFFLMIMAFWTRLFAELIGA